jgi:hypothetical protein
MSDAKDNRFYREPQPSSKELVKSLRDYSEGPTFYWGPICQKAAEEIERLQRELAASAAQYQEACDDANRFARERDEARASPEPSVSLNESGVRQLLGWLSVDIPELNSVEVPRLMDSWEKFNERAGLTKAAEL